MASFQRNKHLLFRQEIAEAFNHENGVTSASKHKVQHAALHLHHPGVSAVTLSQQ
jgi:hypothetical protein